MTRKLFWTSAPSHRNAFDLFAGNWASDLAEIEPSFPHKGIPLFVHDPRPRQAARALGTGGRLDGMTILELGPLEGGHSYQLEQLGAARVTAVEANSEAFLKCLIVKNRLALDRTTFLLGDLLLYLDETTERFDLIVASGILYHMRDPVELIRRIARRTDKVFVWTQYYSSAFRDSHGRKLKHKPIPNRRADLDVALYELTYRRRFGPGFWGGNQTKTCWMERDDIVKTFRHYGFDSIEVIADETSERGPAVTMAVSRR